MRWYESIQVNTSNNLSFVTPSIFMPEKLMSLTVIPSVVIAIEIIDVIFRFLLIFKVLSESDRNGLRRKLLYGPYDLDALFGVSLWGVDDCS